MLILKTPIIYLKVLREVFFVRVMPWNSSFKIIKKSTMKYNFVHYSDYNSLETFGLQQLKDFLSNK
jgi:hypothetical protein